MADQLGADTGAGEIPSVVVRTEDQALALLKQALAEELGEAALNIRFDGWPTITLRYEGKGFDQTVTPEIAEALVALQAAMNRAYARAVYAAGNSRNLTDAERQELQFVARVEKGSSLLNIDMGKFGEKLAEAIGGKMTTNSVVVLVLGVTLAGAGYFVHKDRILAQVEEKKIEADTKTKLQMSQDEIARMKVFADAIAAKPQLAHAAEDFGEARRKAMKAGGHAASVSVQGLTVTGAEAKVLTSSPRSTAVDVQLNGHYSVLKVDWQTADEAKLTVRNADTKEEFVARFKIMHLAPEQKEKLKSAEWDRKSVYMQINGSRLRGEVTSATIVSVSWPGEAAESAQIAAQ